MEECIGKILEFAIRRREINISELSRSMNVSRRTVYNWFERRALNKNIMLAVGKIIEHDFSTELGDDFNDEYQQTTDLEKEYPKLSETFLSETNETHYWMQKYIQLLEAYNQLLENVNSSQNC